MSTRKEIIKSHEEDIHQLSKMYNYSPFMIRELILNFPTDFQAVIRALDKPPLEVIRVNTLKIQPKMLKNRLEEKPIRQISLLGIYPPLLVHFQGGKNSLEKYLERPSMLLLQKLHLQSRRLLGRAIFFFEIRFLFTFLPPKLVIKIWIGQYDIGTGIFTSFLNFQASG